MNPYFPRPSLTVSRHRTLCEKKVYTGNPLDKGTRKDTPMPAPLWLDALVQAAFTLGICWVWLCVAFDREEST